MRCTVLAACLSTSSPSVDDPAFAMCCTAVHRSSHSACQLQASLKMQYLSISSVLLELQFRLSSCKE